MQLSFFRERFVELSLVVLKLVPQFPVLLGLSQNLILKVADLVFKLRNNIIVAIKIVPVINLLPILLLRSIGVVPAVLRCVHGITRQTLLHLRYFLLLLLNTASETLHLQLLKLVDCGF